MFLAGFLVSALRPSHPSQRFTLFGEDGPIFTTQVRSEGVVHSFFTTYAGYYHFLPRLAAAVASALPLRLTPVVYAVSAWAVAAVAGAVAWQCARGAGLSRPAAGVVAGAVVLLPAAGYEVVDTITYVEWYCAAAAVVFVAAWIAGYRPDLRVTVALLVVAGATTPLLVELVPFVAFGYLCRGRRRYDLGVLAGLVAAGAIQIAGRLSTTVVQPSAPLPARSLLDIFLIRVLDAGLFGKRLMLTFYPRLHPAGAAALGLALAVGLAAAGSLELKGLKRLVFWYLAGQAVLVTLVSVVLRPQVVSDAAGVGFWAHPAPSDALSGLLQVGGRYFAVPGVCVVAAVMVWVTGRPVSPRRTYRAGAVAAGTALAVSLVLNLRVDLGRPPSASWLAQLAGARAHCRQSGDRSGVTVTNAPGGPSWRVTITCAEAFGS